VELLERESMLGALAEYAQTARQGDGRLVLVSGESGIGKTALVEAFQSQLKDARWLWGGCDDLVTPRPLGPLFDIAPQASDEFAALCESGAQRDKLFAAFAHEINSGDELTVVVIEDVHWADEATIDLLSYLGRRLSRIRALVLVTYRDDEIGDDHRLRVVLGDLATQRSTRRIGLPPLTAGAVRALIGERDFDAAELLKATGGNPFFVTELVEAGWPSVPPTIRDAVGARLARSSPQARQVLETAAVIGARTDRSLLALVQGDAVDGLGECLESRILVVDGASLRFRHELVRMAVATGIAPQRKADLHARLLAILSERDKVAPAVLAHHAEGAGDGQAVVQYARAAAIASSALGAHREGAALFERALRFAPDADQVTLAGLHEGLAGEYALLDRWEETEAELKAALALRREQGDALRIGEDLRLMSTALWRLCRGDEVVRAAEDAVRALETVPEGVERAWAYANLGACALTRGRIADGLEYCERARASAERLGRPEVQSYALNAIGLGSVNFGREGIGTITEALRIALEHDLQELAGRAYSSLVEAGVIIQRFDLADRYYTEGMAYCDERELGVFGLCMDGWLASARLLTGRWDEAADISRQMLASRGISPLNQLNPLRVLGTIAVRRGDQDAWPLLDQVVELAENNREPTWIVPVRTARAEARWLEGALELAAQEAGRACELAVGQVDPWMTGAAAVCRARLDQPVPVEPPDLPEPFARELAGDAEGAAAAWERLGRHYDAAMVRLGSKDEASLRLALATFDELGATASSGAVRRRMKQLGMQAIPRGSRPATKAAPAGLTAREQEVLSLVADGLADREISQRLFISERTVHHHVSAILSKIGVSSRTAAAREAVKLGIGTQHS
jgi:DNA-binding CsgD family transcriptional regulator/tetratricopeptide (TPR) repeat protein